MLLLQRGPHYVAGEDGRLTRENGGHRCPQRLQAVRKRLVARCPPAVGVCGADRSSPAVPAAMVARTARVRALAQRLVGIGCGQHELRFSILFFQEQC